MEISRRTARRYVLGRQGLWPGRRWRGLRGTASAMRAMEHLQLDPLAIIARAHDLMLASRVIDYTVDDWAVLTYERRRFFEWGGWLAVRPMEELPYWRVLMHRERDNEHLGALAAEHADAIEEMRHTLRKRRLVANRDFAMGDRTRVDHYRGRKDSAVALHYLWRVGEAMVARRDRFERVYAATERVAPRALIREAEPAAADDLILRKQAAHDGLTRFAGMSGMLRRDLPAAELQAWRERQVADGELVEVRVEGWTGPRWAPGADADILATIERGRVPRRWRPLETTTDEEAVFLSPLDPVSARGRAKPLFDFDYTWEVYTPLEKRKYGYYVLPVLWGDRLVARFDARLDRAGRTLVLLGLWLEDERLATDDAFIEAFARGMTRFLRFLDADRVAAERVTQRAIRQRLEGA
jgi:uncharacterized protein YcaQ